MATVRPRYSHEQTIVYATNLEILTSKSHWPKNRMSVTRCAAKSGFQRIVMQTTCRYSGNHWLGSTSSRCFKDEQRIPSFFASRAPNFVSPKWRRGWNMHRKYTQWVYWPQVRKKCMIMLRNIVKEVFSSLARSWRQSEEIAMAFIFTI